MIEIVFSLSIASYRVSDEITIRTINNTQSYAGFSNHLWKSYSIFLHHWCIVFGHPLVAVHLVMILNLYPCSWWGVFSFINWIFYVIFPKIRVTIFNPFIYQIDDMKVRNKKISVYTNVNFNLLIDSCKLHGKFCSINLRFYVVFPKSLYK